MDPSHVVAGKNTFELEIRIGLANTKLKRSTMEKKLKGLASVCVSVLHM
jgi:hypothetical protein